MDIYAFAMQMEKDGEKYYRDLVETSVAQGLKIIFTMLADEEVKHYNFIDKIRTRSGLPEIEDSGILHNVKNVFQDMRKEKQELFANATEDANAYRKALDIELKSKDFYLEKAQEAEDEQAKLLFDLLAKEEKKHEIIMENLVEFASRPEPGNWLENAEWHHLEEY